MFSRSHKGGVLLQQNKEPAFSRETKRFVKPDGFQYIEGRKPAKEGETLSPQEIIDIAKQAQIVDERDGVFLWRKLQDGLEGQKLLTVLGDALDDEPYVSSQMNPMVFYPEQAAAGLRLAAQALGTEKMAFVVYREIFDLRKPLPKQIGNIPVWALRGRYPSEIYLNLDLAAESPFPIGVCALIHLSRAVYENRVQTTCFLTVAGNCVATPSNFEVTVGMTASQIFDRSGLADDPTRIIAGGPMTGVCITDPDTFRVGPTTRALLALRENERDQHFSCIGCGRCIDACPVGISPYHLYHNIKKGRYYQLDRYHVQRCIGCGACSYVCPARLELSYLIFEAKKQKYIQGEGGSEQ